MAMQQLIRDYLASPEGRREATLHEMVAQPRAALSAILNFRGPAPGQMDARDVFPDLLSPLITELLRHCPQLLVDRDLKSMSAGERWVLIAAAIAAEESAFAAVIRGALHDRSIPIKLLAVQALIQKPQWRDAEAEQQLNKLLTQRSLSPWHEDVLRALLAKPAPGQGERPRGSTNKIPAKDLP